MTPPRTIRLSSRDLTVTLDPKSAAFDVRQKRSGTLWRMDRQDRRDLFVRYRGADELVLSLADARSVEGGALGDAEARLTWRGFKGVDSSLGVSLVLRLRGGELDVELSVNDADPSYEFESLYFPRSFLLPNRKDAYWLFPVKGGALIPANHRVDEDARLGWKPTLKCFGAVQKESGFLCRWETPWDCYLGEVNTADRGPKLLPRFLSSLGRWGYDRRLTFDFREKTDYADLVRNAYRPWAMRRGYVHTLREKSEANPKIADLAGGMIFHQLIAYVDRRKMSKTFVTFEHAQRVIEHVAEATGVKGCYHLDGWCRQGYDALHPDVFPPLTDAGGEGGMRKLARAVKALGLRFGLHDNYLLFFPDAEQYRDRHAVWGPDLEPHRDQFRAGGMDFVQSPPAARAFIIANYLTGQNVFRRRWKPAATEYNLEFCYFDQYLLSGGSVEEDFNPAHRLTREQFIFGLLENIRLMREQAGVITSSEHMFDFGVPLYDVNGNSTGLAPHAPKPGRIPAPLWNLAFHECMVVTHVPDSPQTMAMAGLMGALMHHRGSYNDTEEKVAEQVSRIRQCEPLRRLHEELAYRECTGSKLLRADGVRQIADYEGIQVAADLERGVMEVAGTKRADGVYDFAAEYE